MLEKGLREQGNPGSREGWGGLALQRGSLPAAQKDGGRQALGCVSALLPVGIRSLVFLPLS